MRDCGRRENALGPHRLGARDKLSLNKLMIFVGLLAAEECIGQSWTGMSSSCEIQAEILRLFGHAL